MTEKAGGKIIFLNGVSSSGKTTIAKELQAILDEVYLHISVDKFISLLPEHGINDPEILRVEIPKIVSGFHQSIGALASTGNNVIVDHVLQEEPWLKECVDALADFRILFVGVMCPLDELEKRENAREDRQKGMAKYQFDRVHSHGVYDLEVDTSKLDLRESALQIKNYIDSGKTPNAFKQLKNKVPPADY